MIKQAVRLAIIAGVWKRYKIGIVSSLLLLGYLILLSVSHGEFLSYSQSIDSKAYVGLSFVLKWLLGFTGIAVFLAYHLWWRGLSDKGKLSTERQTKHHKKPPSNNKEKRSGGENTESTATAPDPFATLREKPQLRSRGDFVLEKHNKNQ